MSQFLKTVSNLLLGSLLLFAISSHGADLRDIEFITESYPPYNYEENGVVKGITVEILLEASKEAGQVLSRSQIKLRPWARGYRKALNGPMTMLFSMSRTKERESKFQWVGPILKNRVAVLAKKSSAIKIGSSDDLKKYSIGAVLDDVGEQMVKALGSSSNVQTSATPSALAKKLNSGRVQLWVYDETVAQSVIKSAGLKGSDFEAVFTLKETASYYALSKDVPKQLVDLLQAGLDKLKKRNGGKDYEALVNGN
ncbi:MAG: transporter substrate-binding domain-containing protein [Bermanella sp.]